MNGPQDLQATMPEPRGQSAPETEKPGDRKAMARFVEAHADAVYRFLHHRLDRKDLLDDLVQEVFLAAWRALDRFRGESEVRTWLLGIARHKLADHYRARMRGADLPLEPDAGADEPSAILDVDTRLDAATRDARARATLSKLPEMYRAVLLWHYWDERSTAEIAAETGKTAKAIERLLDRARRLFKRRWNDD